MTHTPGPWKVTAGIVDNPRLIVEDDIGNPVCAMSLRGVYGDTVKMTANAALIAAAPDLLTATEAWVAAMDKWLETGIPSTPDESKAIYEAAVAAVKKARCGE